MKLSLTLQQDFQAPELVLKRAYIKKTVETALRYIGTQSDCEIGIACVGHEESHKLNLEYRKKDKPTNVLSFPSDLPDEMAEILDVFPIGDLVICIPVVLQEAAEQQKTPIEHFTHMPISFFSIFFNLIPKRTITWIIPFKILHHNTIFHTLHFFYN